MLVRAVRAAAAKRDLLHICHLRYFRLALPIFLSLPAKEKSILLDNEGGSTSS